VTYFPTYFPRSENHNDWVKGLTSTRQEAGFTVLNAASADVVNSAKCSKDFMEYEVCLCDVVKLKALHAVGLEFESLIAHPFHPPSNTKICRTSWGIAILGWLNGSDTKEYAVRLLIIVL
jgi:hypothetical protein